LLEGISRGGDRFVYILKDTVASGETSSSYRATMADFGQDLSNDVTDKSFVDLHGESLLVNISEEL